MIKIHIFRDYFINFRFSGKKSQSQKEKAKKITNFTIEFHSKNPSHFVTNLNSLNIIKNILSQHSQRNVSGWGQKNYF